MNRQRALLVDVYSRPASWQRATTRVDGHALVLAVGLLMLLTCAGLLYLSQASTAAELRYTLQERREKQQELQEQITRLRCMVARLESITSLEPRAERLGLVDAQPGDPEMVCYVPATALAAAAGPPGSQRRAWPVFDLSALLEWLHLAPAPQSAQLR